MKRLDHALLYVRTVRHLRPEQFAHRVRLRTQRAMLARVPDAVVERIRPLDVSATGWPSGFSPLESQLPPQCPGAAENAEGRFVFLNHERALGEPADWDQTGAAQLWRYHLHYFEWAWCFAAHADREWATKAFGELWKSWRAAARFGRGDAWSPYVASLRAWVLCGVFDALVRHSPEEAAFRDDMALHARFLRAHLELDVGGNHLIKNLKAIAGLGVFLDDQRLIALARRRLAKEIGVQVLPDGGHYELSPSYHCQVLGDLIDVGALLAAAGQPPVPGLDDAVGAMRRWLGTMLMPDGDVPMFNDCWLIGTDRVALLEPSDRPAQRLTVLQPSGYVVMRPGPRMHLVADVGPPCPPSLPAHAHADCLSFELAVDGERVIVNSGTSTYEPGERRAYERSTAAHNTVEIDGQDQTEVWGAFRAARRAQAVLERAVDTAEVIEVTASHDGYRRLAGRPIHRRTWRTQPGPEVERLYITDEITGAGRHRLKWRLHTAPGCQPTPSDSNSIGMRRAAISVSRPVDPRLPVVDAEVARRFGCLDAGRVVEVPLASDLPAFVETVIVPAASSARAPTTTLESAGSMGFQS